MADQADDNGQAAFEEILDGISDLVPESGNRVAFAKSIHSILQENSDVSFQVMNINAEALSAFEMPRGLVVVVGKRAPVQLELMNRAPVAALVICDLGDTAADGVTRLTKDYFRDAKRMEQLRTAVAQFSPLPARDIGATKENEHWEAELGSHGWVSVAATKERTAGTRKQTRFHIAVRASAGALDAEYYDWIKSEVATQPIAAGAVAEHAHTKRLQQVARRNACRIAYQAARALGVTVPTQEDVDSVYARSREFRAPLMARPAFVQLSNTMEMNREDDTVTIHSSTTPVTTGIGADAVVLFNPQEGFGRFHNVDDGWGVGRKVYPVGLRKERLDHATTVEGDAPRHFVPNAQCTQVAQKYAPSDRYAAPDRAVLEVLGTDSDRFTHYKHVSLLTTDPLLDRPAPSLLGH